MKRLCMLLPIVLILIAGASYAEDQAGPAVDKWKPVSLIAQAPSAPAEPETTGAENQAPARPGEPETRIHRPRLGFGLTAGLYNPTNSLVRDVFGKNWFRFGIRPMPTELPERWRVMFDVSYYAMSNEDDDVTIIPVSVGLIRGFGKSEKRRAYGAVNVGPYYCNLNAPSMGLDKTGWGLGANATVGVMFRNRWSIEARYELMDKFEGLDFSAFTISAAYKLFETRF
ncbi:MAG TPA: outer membrane beta-barrel protein [Armatimonadota bacterium]|nr:outer membrane beta-barrel protein [Armatimonadota bacterium]